MIAIGHSEVQSKPIVVGLEPSHQAALSIAGFHLLLQVLQLTRLHHFLRNLPGPQSPGKSVSFSTEILWGERNRISFHWGATSRRRYLGFV